MSRRIRKRIPPLVALLLCGLSAWAITLVKWNAPERVLVPFAFLIVVLAAGARYGRTVGILGSIIAAAIFARSLYHPFGSFGVQEQAARQSLAWMLLAGVAISFLLLPERFSSPRK